MSFNKINILINCPSIHFINNKKKETLGGIESLVLALADELSKRKFNITLSSSCKKTFVKNDIIYVPIDKIKKNPKKYIFNSIISSNDATIFNSYKENKNKIFWLHNKLQIEKSIRKKQFYSIIKNNLKAVFVSNYLNKFTSNLYFFKKRLVINNFLLPTFKIKKIQNNRSRIFVWSVQREKGLNEVINMWINDIYKYSKHVKFYIFGIKKLTKNYNKKYLNSKNIFFKGRVEKKELKEIYSKSMGMICLGYDETFCLNALEANACGLPVITLGKTALNDYVINNHNGLVVSNISEISSKVKYLLKLKSRKKIIYNSIAYSKKFHLETVIYDWLKLLK
jgi:glycosyltransferase involved in cell wall biosynthesis